MQVKEYDAQPPPKVAKDRLHFLDSHDDLGGMTVSELEALHATVDEELDDPKFTLPTITSYGNILIQTPNANGDNTIRYCTIRELANASSFYPEQVAFLDQLDKQKLGFCALQYISSAVPRGLLTTMYRMALFTLHRHEDFNFHSSYYCYTLDDEPFDGILQGEAGTHFHVTAFADRPLKKAPIDLRARSVVWVAWFVILCREAVFVD